MVDEVITNTLGLIVGFGAAQTLGDFAESKIKPGIVATSTSQDKMVAETVNDGSKIALAYGVYAAGKSSAFAKSAVVGTVLSTLFDVYWRYKHEGIPYSGYKTVPIETPVGTPISSPIVTPPVETPPVETPPPTDKTGGRLFLISDIDTLEDIIVQGRILEEI